MWLSVVNLLVYEYESRIASIGKDKYKHNGFTCQAEKTKSADIAIVKRAAKRIERSPLGRARSLVRGFNLSYCRSAIRLKAIAALRAPTIAARIQPVCPMVGSPLRASSTAMNAKGKAKTVCSNLIMSSVMRNFCRTKARLPARERLSLTHYDLLEATT